MAERKVFLRTVVGLLVFGCVTMGLRAASHELNRAKSQLVASEVINGFAVAVAETPLNPDDSMDSQGRNRDGYYYTCTVSKNSLPLSSFTIRRWKGYRADGVDIQKLRMIRSTRTMLLIDFPDGDTDSREISCMISPPPASDPSAGTAVDWHELEVTGV